jgi:hypothetical protein
MWKNATDGQVRISMFNAWRRHPRSKYKADISENLGGQNTPSIIFILFCAITTVQFNQWHLQDIIPNVRSVALPPLTRLAHLQPHVWFYRTMRNKASCRFLAASFGVQMEGRVWWFSWRVLRRMQLCWYGQYFGKNGSSETDNMSSVFDYIDIVDWANSPNIFSEGSFDRLEAVV